jgi:hypothetical protein
MIRIFVEYDDDDEEHTAIRIAEIIRKHNSVPATFVKVTQRIVRRDKYDRGAAKKKKIPKK